MVIFPKRRDLPSIAMPAVIGGRNGDLLARTSHAGFPDGGELMEIGDTVDRSLRAGRFLRRTFGDRLESLRLRPGITMKPANAPMKRLSGGSTALSLEEARDAVGNIIAAENTGHPMQPRMTFAPAVRADELAASLLAFAEAQPG